MTTFKIEPITTNDDPTSTPILARTPEVVLSIDVLVDGAQLQLRWSGTDDLVRSPHLFSTDCAESCSVRFLFPREGLGWVTIAQISESYYDDDRDGVVEVVLASPGDYTAEIFWQSSQRSAQRGDVLSPQTPTTKVVLRPRTNCPQPKDTP